MLFFNDNIILAIVSSLISVTISVTASSQSIILIIILLIYIYLYYINNSMSTVLVASIN